MKVSLVTLFGVFLIFQVDAQKNINYTAYESNIVFYGFKDSLSNSFISYFNESIENFGCTASSNVSIIVHGWTEGITTTYWVNKTVANLLKHSNGCVFFMDYSVYARDQNYGFLVSHYDGILKFLIKKLLQIGNPERIYMFGFSYGSRLSVEAGFATFKGAISRMDLCDPAGPSFDGTTRALVPTIAAKNVACISTSSNYGTTTYNCHQNFRMGQCGTYQPAHSNYPKGSHGLCPYFYNSAFDFDFIPNNNDKCTSHRMAVVKGEDVKLGYLAKFNRTAVRGDIFISTAAREPYVAVQATDILNSLNTLTNLIKTFDQRQFQKRDDAGDAAMMKLRSDIKNYGPNLIIYLFNFIDRLDKSYSTSVIFT